MNIPDCLALNANDACQIVCPGCHTQDYRKHGCYARKGFHSPFFARVIMLLVQRYRCLNPACPRCTFSVLPPFVLRYSRFFWPCLLGIKLALTAGTTLKNLSHVWYVSKGVIRRAKILLDLLGSWVEELYQELTASKQIRNLKIRVKIIIGKLGRIELTHRWYRHRYPRRFSDRNQKHTI